MAEVQVRSESLFSKEGRELTFQRVRVSFLSLLKTHAHTHTHPHPHTLFREFKEVSSLSPKHTHIPHTHTHFPES